MRKSHINCSLYPITIEEFDPANNYNFLMQAMFSQDSGTQESLRRWSPIRRPGAFSDFSVHYLSNAFGFSIDSHGIIYSFAPKVEPVYWTSEVDGKMIRELLSLPDWLYLTDLHIFGHPVEKEKQKINVRKERFEVLAGVNLAEEVWRLIENLHKEHKKARGR